MFEMMEGATWAQVRRATDAGHAISLIHLHRALCEFARVRACEAVARALEAAR